MKLNEIKQLAGGEVDLKEGVIPVHITMTLEQIIRAGQITNSVQTFVMAGLVDMFKDGGPYRWPRDLNAYGMSTMGTSSDMVEAINGLQADEQVQIAEWLLTKVQVIGNFEAEPCADTEPKMFLMSLLKKTND